jgi:hypothetical protein
MIAVHRPLTPKGNFLWERDEHKGTCIAPSLLLLVRAWKKYHFNHFVASARSNSERHQRDFSDTFDLQWVSEPFDCL